MAGDWTTGDLEPHYMLTVIHQRADSPTGTMTVLRSTITGQKVGNGPIPGNLHPFPPSFSAQQTGKLQAGKRVLNRANINSSVISSNRSI